MVKIQKVIKMGTIKVVPVNVQSPLVSYYGCITLTLHLIPSGLIDIAMANRV